LADLESDFGKHRQAQRLYERALAIREETVPPSHPVIAKSLTGLASVHLRAGRLSRAEPLLARALAIFEAAGNPDSKDLTVARENYAFVLRKAKRDTEADAVEEGARKAFRP
jgi:hypothetical protein